MTGRGDGAEEEAGGPATEEVAGRRAPRRIPFPFLVLALAILATLVRLPYLQQIPRSPTNGMTRKRLWPSPASRATGR